jgi:CheY-like chemotaxis protein
MQEVIKKRKNISILMVEDNPMDALLTTEILSETEDVDYQVNTVSDGVEALAYLHRTNGYENAPLPDLIVLDLNLPRMHGFDFLSRIKTDPELKTIPVCILTTSEAEEDVEKAKELKADCYFLKPLDLNEFEAVVSGIKVD